MKGVKTQVWCDGVVVVDVENYYQNLISAFIETNKNQNINGEKEMKVSHVNYIKGETDQ